MCEKTDTYDYDRSNEHSVYEEVAWLCEARRFALDGAAVLVKEVWIQQNGELRFRNKKPSEDTPDLRHNPCGEDHVACEDKLVQANNPAITQS